MEFHVQFNLITMFTAKILVDFFAFLSCLVGWLLGAWTLNAVSLSQLECDMANRANAFHVSKQYMQVQSLRRKTTEPRTENNNRRSKSKWTAIEIWTLNNNTAHNFNSLTKMQTVQRGKMCLFAVWECYRIESNICADRRQQAKEVLFKSTGLFQVLIVPDVCLCTFKIMILKKTSHFSSVSKSEH